MAGKFVHLHLHTEYSLLDGLSKISKLMTRVKELEMDTVAITDHGTMYGAIEFYKTAKKEDVRPIIGVEAYTVLYDHREKPEKERYNYNHLLLLAKNEEGYKNLMKLTSIAHLEGYYFRPRFMRQILEKYSKGIICTSACVNGEVARAIIDGDIDTARKTAKWFNQVFGKDYYLEVQRHEYGKYVESAPPEMKMELARQQEIETLVNTEIVKLSRELGIPLVATNDAHYINKEDASAQDALVCVATGKKVQETRRIRMVDTPTYYARSPQEMADLFPDYPDALKNTVEIGKKCNLEIVLDKWFFPKYKLEGKLTENEEMEKRTWDGISRRVDIITTEIKDRLEYELKIIKEKGYATYFLIVSDMAQWASENGIVTNTRGSAAGSLVSYAMGIINLNPLDYGLPFERFLTPWRPTPPDIDFDIADDRRDDVVKYIVDKYGQDKVAQTCTFGRMLGRAAVRDVARVLGYDYAIGDRISKLIPPPKQGFPINIEKAMSVTPQLKELYDTDPDTKKILDLAKQVEGNARHISVHAAGVVISPTTLADFTPVQHEPKGEKVITQYDMYALDPNVSPGGAVGLLKFDLLGLRNLSILGLAIKIVKERKNVEIDIIKLPLNDRKTFEMLSRGETMGVFQLSSSGMTRYVKELKPTRVEDLMAMVALYRPGPIAFIPEYIERKRHPESIKYIDPRMKEYMGLSYGLMIYQEDCLLTAINIAGYTWEEADKFRKAIGKKIPEEMAKQHDHFVEGSVKNGMSEDKAEELFKLIEKFAAYGFNKGHSASYGLVAYQTAYMKANYPVPYMCALLTSESGDKDKISAAIIECKRMGIMVLAPDINESNIGFSIVKNEQSLGGEAIRFGLSAIKNVGEAAIEAILEAREESAFTSLTDFLSRVDGRRVNKRVLESLIKVGALAKFGKRSAILASIDEIRERVKPKKATGQQELFGSLPKKLEDVSSTILIDIDEFSESEIENLERQLLGLSLSARPISETLGNLLKFSTHKIDELSVEEEYKDIVKIAGLVSEVRNVVTKKSGAQMVFVKLDDGTGILNLVVFPKVYKDTIDIWVEGKPVLVFGKIDVRDEELNLLVENVFTKETVQNKDAMFFVRIPKNVGVSLLKKIKEIFLMYPGEQKVTLLFEGSDTKVTYPFGISWTEEMSHQIEQILESVEDLS